MYRPAPALSMGTMALKRDKAQPSPRPVPEYSQPRVRDRGVSAVPVSDSSGA